MSSNAAIDDTSPRIQYDPDTAWQLDTSLGVYVPYNGTIHGTTQVNAKATLQFTGTSISVTCLLWPTGSNFTATLDNSLLGTYNTAVTSISAAVPKVIFTKDSLDGNTQHTLVIEKAPNDPAWVSTVPGDESSHLHIDSITIVGGSDSPASPTPQLSSSSSTGPGAGVIAGIVVGVIAAIALIAAAFVWYRRRVSRVARQSTGPSPFTTETGAQPGDKRSEQVTSITSGGEPDPAVASPTSRPTPRTSPREKVGMLFSNRNEDPGNNSRSRWRTSLFELPGHRVVRAQSGLPPGAAPVEWEGESNTPIGVQPSAPLALGTSSPEPQRRETTVLSPISGSESRFTESTEPPSTVLSSPPVREHALSSVASSSSPERGAPARTAKATTHEKSQFHGRNNSGTGSSLNPTASSIPPPSMSPPSSSASGGVNTSLLLQENAMLRDQVRHLAALQRTGGGVGGVGGSLYDEGRSDYHEPPPEYVGRDSDEESRP
ncbi:hypothetical protein M408DRAFT_328980 [Serendipita vermifera MAFF 305830]|uniref:Uncharacterized protein n=1 Tax=Serendipita vermifera MAFF 305830 TaxID=933852 RepID=A0A0C3AXU9_SERVB|nr:hypothetical protein M408DRAFT_328980 [Serendipita vermifera MAFF 305830]